MEDRDGARLSGREDIRALAEDWNAMAELDNRRRANTPVSLSIVLSMPAQTDPLALRDAARAFAAETFAGRFDYVFVLHTDAGHPHVHLTVRTLGDQGERLNPKKADLEAWRQTFARNLRERGVAAEATPRRARGVTRKAETTAVRKLRERLAAGLGGLPQVTAQAYREAAPLAFGAPVVATPWELAIARRQARVRLLYMSEARVLMGSPDEADRALGRAVAKFVRDMPEADTQRLALARELRAVHARQAQMDLFRRDPSHERDR
jgi:type IV secretory pathway VirD2 relaxase